MARKIIFPMNVKVAGRGNVIIPNHAALYEFYHTVKSEALTEFSKQFWEEGINLTELVLFPEKFTIIPDHPSQSNHYPY